MAPVALRIKAPIDSLAEADPLIAAGADELFCAVRLGETSCSCPRAEVREDKVCLSGLDELDALVAFAHGRGVKVQVALNDPRARTASLTQQLVRANLGRLESSGIDAVIVSTLAVLRLVQRQTKLPIVAGSYFAAINPEAIAFLEHLGVVGVILERQVALADLQAIAAAKPEVELGVFILASACRSLCLYCHRSALSPSPGEQGVHLCHLPLRVTPSDPHCGAPPADELRAMARRLRMPRHGCGLCAIPTLHRYGITVAKIVGRGHDTALKVAHVQMLRAALDALAAGRDGDGYFELARELFQHTLRRPCNREDCYYPHLLGGS